MDPDRDVDWIPLFQNVSEARKSEKRQYMDRWQGKSRNSPMVNTGETQQTKQKG